MQERRAEAVLQKIKNADFPPAQCSLITMYSTTWCGACKESRKDLKKANVVFIEHLVDLNPKQKLIMERKQDEAGLSGYGYPTFVINGKAEKYYYAEELMKLSCEKN